MQFKNGLHVNIYHITIMFHNGYVIYALKGISWIKCTFWVSFETLTVHSSGKCCCVWLDFLSSSGDFYCSKGYGKLLVIFYGHLWSSLTVYRCCISCSANKQIVFNCLISLSVNGFQNSLINFLINIILIKYP